MKYVLLCLLGILLPVGSFGQQPLQNALLPEELLVTTTCPIDEAFVDSANGHAWAGLYYSMQDYTGGKLPVLLYDLAFNAQCRVRESNYRSGDYPYDLDRMRTLKPDDVMALFGKAKDGQPGKGEGLVLDIQAIQFVEGWVLDVEQNVFSKQVRHLIPMQVDVVPGDAKGVVKKVCAIEPDHSNVEKGELVARVKYEVCLFDYEKQSNEIAEEEYLFERQMPGSPFFSGMSRLRMIHFLWSMTVKRPRPAYDFYTNQRVVVDSVINSAFGYWFREEDGVDAVNGMPLRKVIMTKMGAVRSVVFCEAWYVDARTGSFTKEVLGVAPVAWDFQTGKKSHPILVWLDKERMF